MVFDSISFAIFFVIVFGLFWSLPSRWKPYLLLVSSYVFYAFNGLRVLPLIILSTIIDYWCGLKISRNQKPKLFLWVSILGNLSLLFYFKYSAFVVMNVNGVLSMFGSHTQFPVPAMAFPVGISFFTFQTMAYTIDVYRKRIPHEKNVPMFFLFVSYFPQLVAGPLERAEDLLPQLWKPKFDAAKVPAAVLLISWGLFKKTIVADRLYWVIKEVTDAPEAFSGLHYIFTTLMIVPRIYCDFSGYCDIAMGCAALLGVKLTLNFDAPFWSPNISEFWKRWHITLNLWFRDYVYVLFAGKDGTFSTLRKVLGVMTVFILSGLWHGPTWTFVIWGALNGGAYAFLILTRQSRKKVSEALGISRLPENFIWVSGVIITNLYLCIAAVYFQSHTLHEATTYITHAFQNDFLPSGKSFFSYFNSRGFDAMLASTMMVLIELVNLAHVKKFRIANLSAWPVSLIWLCAWALVVIVFLFGYENKVPFSYYYY